MMSPSIILYVWRREERYPRLVLRFARADFPGRLVWHNRTTQVEGNWAMEEVKLSEKAIRQIDGLNATNERLHVEGLELEDRTRELEALALRKENMVRRYQEFLAEVRAERQAIEAEYQRIRGTSLSHQ